MKIERASIGISGDFLQVVLTHEDGSKELLVYNEDHPGVILEVDYEGDLQFVELGDDGE